MIADEEYGSQGSVRGSGRAGVSSSRMSGLAIVSFVFAFVFPPLGTLLGIIAIIVISVSRGRLRGLGFAISAVPVSLFFAGILSAVTIPAFINYTKKAKTSEAGYNVSRCLDGAILYYEQNGALPATSDWTPAQPPSDQKYFADPNVWNVSPWKEFDFSLVDNHYYRYRFVNEGSRFYCQAQGDLDGDGTMSLFERDGVVEPGGVIQGNSGLYKSDPLE